MGPGTYVLQVEDSACGQQSFRVQVSEGSADVVLDPTVRSESVIVGRVVDLLGTPLPHWRVAWAADGPLVRDAREIESDSEGQFKLPTCDDVVYQISALHQDQPPIAEMPSFSSAPVRARGGQRDVVVVAAAMATLDVEVRFVGAAPPRRYDLFIGGDRFMREGSELAFQLQVPSAQNLRVVLEASGFVTTDQMLRAKADQVTPLTVVAYAGQRLAGRVIDAETRAPVVDAVISAPLPAADRYPSAMTDTNGRFELEEMPQGPSFLAVRSDDYQAEKLGPFTPGGAEIELALVRGRALRGRLRIGDLPCAQCVLTVSDECVTRTGATGAFVLGCVSPGPVVLKTKTSLVKPRVQARTFIIGTEAGDLDLDLDAPGTARLEATLPVMDAMNLITVEVDGVGHTLITGTRLFVLTGLDVGEHAVKLITRDGRSVAATARVGEPGATARVALEL